MKVEGAVPETAKKRRQVGWNRGQGAFDPGVGPEFRGAASQFWGEV